MPIVADYFDKDLHYDATHYLYEPEDMSELLNQPRPEEHDPEIHHSSPTIVEQDDSYDDKEVIESIIEKVEESV